MLDLIVSVPGHCLSFYFAHSDFLCHLTHVKKLFSVRGSLDLSSNLSDT